MKAVALALALVVSAVQTVGWVDCCCVLICKHQDKTCGECEEKAKAPAPESCCEKTQTAANDHRNHQNSDAACAHVQPSSEVASHADPLPPVVLLVVLELPVVPFQPSSEAFEKTSSLFSQTRGSPPLHILNSVFLI